MMRIRTCAWPSTRYGMELLLATTALLFSCAAVRAAAAVVAVTSCDETYQAQAAQPGWITITGKSGKSASIRISHQIDGGSFSPHNTYLALYGVPMRADLKKPPVSLLTLYQLPGQPRTIIRHTFDSPIRSAHFSADGKFLVISTQTEVQVLDFARKRLDYHNHNAAYTPDFPLAVCGKSATP